MAMLTKELILAADDRKFEDVDVPEWGGTIRISEMSSKDRDDFDAGTIRIIGKKVEPVYDSRRAKLLSFCIVDDEGKRMFSSGDVEALALKSGNVITRLCDVAERLNGMTREAVEDQVKN